MSPDGKSYTFTLHKDVGFHNGNPFTSADVKFSLERVKDPPTGVKSPRRNNLDAIASIETPNDYTVKLNLRRPSPSLLVNLADDWMAMYDREWVTEKDQHRPAKELNGTGPYKLKQYIRGTSIELERNPGYWVQGRPYLDGVKKFTIPDSGTRLAALRTGQVHMLGVPAADVDTFKKLPGFTIQTSGGVGFTSLRVNPTRAPFTDERVRLAVGLVLDRKEIIQFLTGGAADLGGYLPPQGQWALPPAELAKLPGYGSDRAADLAQAKKLMAEAGYGSGVSVISSGEAQFEPLQTVITDQLSKIGIKVTVKMETSAVAYDLATKRDFQVLPWGHSAGIDDPDSIFGEFYTCAGVRNYSGICSQEVDDLYVKQSQTIDPAERKKLVHDMERKAVPLGIIYVLQWSHASWGVWDFVRDYIHTTMSSYGNKKMRDVWLDK